MRNEKRFKKWNEKEEERERQKDWIRKVKLKEETDLELHRFLRDE